MSSTPMAREPLVDERRGLELLIAEFGVLVQPAAIGDDPGHDLVDASARFIDA